MDPRLLETVRAQLEKSGYTDIPDSLLEEFTHRLQNDDEFSFTAAPPPSTSPPRKSKPSKEPTPPPTSTTNTIVHPPEPTPDPSRTRTSVSSQNSLKKNDYDPEISHWSERIHAIQKKAGNLDSEIRGCKSSVIHSPRGSRSGGVDVKIYFGAAVKPSDPYPAVIREYASGGFIRPPPVRASRRKWGSAQEPKKRLLYKERFPDYVPVTDNRRDELRWEIRKKVVYSDPKYRS
jgi:hypothetical protein